MRSLNEYILQGRSKVKNRFYVYVHRKESDNSVFYIGKGCGSRAWNTHCRNKFWKNTFKKHGVIVDVVASDLFEDDAYSLEEDLISLYMAFKCRLCNLSKGGKNEKFSDYSKKQMSISRKGRPATKGSAERLMLWRQSQQPVHVSENHSSDKSTYTFIHIDTLEQFKGKRWEFAEKIGKTPKDIKGLFSSSRANRPLYGWVLLSDLPIEQAIAFAKSRKTTEDTSTYRFVSATSEYVGTRKEFSTTYNINPAQVSSLFCKSPRDIVHGWKLDKEFNNEQA